MPSNMAVIDSMLLTVSHITAYSSVHLMGSRRTRLEQIRNRTEGNEMSREDQRPGSESYPS